MVDEAGRQDPIGASHFSCGEGRPADPAATLGLRGERSRWCGAALLAAAAHAGLMWLAITWADAMPAPGEPPPAITIDLTLVAVAPAAAPQELEPGPPVAAVETEARPVEDIKTKTPADPPPSDPEPPRLEETFAQASPPIAAAEPVLDPPLPSIAAPAELADLTPPRPVEITLPDLPEIPLAEAVLPPPPRAVAPRPDVTERPKPPRKTPPAKKEPPPKKEASRQKPVERAGPPRQQASAPPSARAQRAESAAPSAGASANASVSPASWRSELVAHLNRFKRFPPGAGSGTVSVAFTIARSGQVLSARLAGSSGDAALDAEAVTLPRRASPVPAPPSGLGGNTIALSVPIRFSR